MALFPQTTKVILVKHPQLIKFQLVVREKPQIVEKKLQERHLTHQVLHARLPEQGAQLKVLILRQLLSHQVLHARLPEQGV
jgi:hypothetical protein